jgi:multiple sugar transport system substrate-binding protein
MDGRKVSRREFLLWSALATVPVALASCTAAPAPATTTEQVKEEPVELRVSHWWGVNLRELIEAFPIYEKTHPNMTVVEERLPFSGYHEGLLTALAGGVAPDAFLTDTYFSDAFYKSGTLLALNDHIDAHGVDIGKMAYDPHVSVGYQGNIYAMDVMVPSGQALWINLNLAEEAGVDQNLPTWGTPEWDTWTWDDMLEFLKAGTKIKSNGEVEQYGLNRAPSFGQSLNGLVAGAGGMLFPIEDWWAREEKECTINSPEAVDAYQQLVDLVFEHKVAPAPEALQAMQVEGGLYTAELAMCEMSGIGVHAHRRVPFVDRQTLIALPFIGERAQHIGGNFWCVTAASKRIAEAAEMAIFITTDRDVLATQVLNHNAPNYETRFHVDPLTGWPKEAQETRIARHAIVSAVPDIAKTVATYPLWLGAHAGFVGDTMTAALEFMYLQEKSVQQALDEAKAAIDGKLQAA